MIKNLSIIFPIYNEEKRLKKGLRHIEKFILINKNKQIQVIIVNDGSNDNSINILADFQSNFTNKNNSKLRIINLKKNIGKGGAISSGLKYAMYKSVLTADIDMSVPLRQFIIWENKFLNTGLDKKVFFGSRAHTLSNVQRQIFRQILGYLMRKIINTILGITIKDTQCGFKLYPTYIAKKVFKKLARPRYEHDIEVVLRLKKEKVNILELPVLWTHKNYSKVNIFTDPIKMFLGLIFLKKKYL